MPERIKKDIVFTNGCFDVFHYGHLHILREAKKLGDFLIVGINSDESVKRLKGKDRPIFSYNYRADIIASILYVDGVVSFDDDTPLELIKRIKPKILVKGGDWKGNVVGSDFVKSIGGSVKMIDIIPGFSTTEIIKCIKEQSTG